MADTAVAPDVLLAPSVASKKRPAEEEAKRENGEPVADTPSPTAVAFSSEEPTAAAAATPAAPGGAFGAAFGASPLSGFGGVAAGGGSGGFGAFGGLASTASPFGSAAAGGGGGFGGGGFGGGGVKPRGGGDDADAEEDAPHDASPPPPAPEYKPLFTLPEAPRARVTGEEDEVAVFTAHCVLFAFESPEAGKPPTWRERGRGEARLLSGRNGGARVVMRAAGALRLILNASLYHSCAAAMMDGGKGVSLAVANAAEGEQPETSGAAASADVSSLGVKTYALRVKGGDAEEKAAAFLSSLRALVAALPATGKPTSDEAGGGGHASAKPDDAAEVGIV